jgi:16S rRNA A1518/A1519 N6-dimethyltransferase RsmA/KsgA/DIM1 with predicted DNA glycosylase/AP lyase activity
MTDAFDVCSLLRKRIKSSTPVAIFSAYIVAGRLFERLPYCLMLQGNPFRPSPVVQSADAKLEPEPLRRSDEPGKDEQAFARIALSRSPWQPG